MLPSISNNQSEILESIRNLHCNGSFDADISYGNGSFYVSATHPALKFDIVPQVAGVVQACSTKLPLLDGSLDSVVFDPPFLTYVRAARNHNSIMAKRFGGYWTYAELEEHYNGTLKECSRILGPKGILVFKCQDIVHNHSLHLTHVNVINWAAEYGFKVKDIFILTAKHRMPIPPAQGYAPKKQKHARIHHSFFIVLAKKPLAAHNKGEKSDT